MSALPDMLIGFSSTALIRGVSTGSELIVALPFCILGLSLLT